MDLFRVAIIGGGNMGNAVAQALGRPGGVLDGQSERLIIAEPDTTKHEALRDAGTIANTAREAITNLAPDGFVVLAVKPQVFPSVCPDIRGLIGNRLVISVMAGTLAQSVQRELGGNCRVVRAMPNLPVTLGHGVTGISAGPGASGADMGVAQQIFSAMGLCEEIPEAMMDAITAVASSGPAYVFYLAEAMIAAAVRMGFSSEQADSFVRATIDGAAAMLMQDPSPPEELRRRITSRGGTTQAATEVLDATGVKESIAKAIEAARNRGQQLSRS